MLCSVWHCVLLILRPFSYLAAALTRQDRRWVGGLGVTSKTEVTHFPGPRQTLIVPSPRQKIPDHSSESSLRQARYSNDKYNNVRLSIRRQRGEVSLKLLSFTLL